MFDQNSYEALQLISPPQRVVSLVPSLTESLFDLGLGDVVVGITDYCVHPREISDTVTRLGGTKNPQIALILDLEPDLVLANREENRRETIQALDNEGIKVWVSFPKTVREVLDILWILIKLFRKSESAQQLRQLEKVIQWAEQAAATQKKQRYFCPIWQEKTDTGEYWWMTFNRDSYPSDLLVHMGGENIFDGRDRRYPLDADLGRSEPENAGDRDTRYPRVSLDEILNGNPEIILLPDEPYKFGSGHKKQITELLVDTAAVKLQQVYLIDGSLITWHGTRMSRAFQDLPVLFS